MELDLPDYSQLNQMYFGPLAARMAQDNNDQKGQLAQMMLQQQQESNRHTAQLNPMLIQEKQGAINTQNARLPGIYMDNATKALTLDKESRTHEDEIDSILTGYKGKKSKEELDDLTRAGEMYNQAGAYLSTVPPAAVHAVAKQMLGKYYRPEFDQYNGGDLVDTISTAGQWMTSAQGKYQQSMQKQNDAQEARRKEVEFKANKAKELAQYRESIKKVVTQQAKTGKVAENYRTFSAQLMRQAQLEEDPEKKAVLLEQAQEYTNFYFAELDRKAQATAAGKPDPGKLGFEKPDPVPVPTVAAPGAGTPKPKEPPPKKHLLSDVQKMYPGVPPDKLKQAYKAKFGVDLQ